MIITFNSAEDAITFTTLIRSRFGFGCRVLHDTTVHVGYGFGGLAHLVGETQQQIQKLAEDIGGVLE